MKTLKTLNQRLWGGNQDYFKGWPRRGLSFYGLIVL